MRLIFGQEQITGTGAYRSFFQDQVILNGGADFGKLESGRHYIRREEAVPMAELLAMIAAGAEVDELAVIARAPASLLEEPVPEGLPYREDEAGVKTFATWGAAMRRSHDGQEVCLVLTMNGRYLKGSEWSLLAPHVLELMGVEQYRALMETENWRVE